MGRRSPELAKALPTVATARGRHVYCRSNHRGIKQFRRRGTSTARATACLPPSLHPSGVAYRWVIPLADGKSRWSKTCALLVYFLSPTKQREQSVQRGQRYRTEENRSNERGGWWETPHPCPPTHPLNCPVLSVTSGDTTAAAATDRAVMETIPTSIGRRNRQVFQLARALKAIPRLADAPVDVLKPHVQRWHRIGLEKGVVGDRTL